MQFPCRSNATLCRGLERLLSERHGRGMAGERHRNGMACVNQTRPHCVNEMGKTQSKPLAERHGMWVLAFNAAGKRHGMCELALSVNIFTHLLRFRRILRRYGIVAVL
jgi:hypothetical protein